MRYLPNTTAAIFTKTSNTTIGYVPAQEKEELYTDPKLLAMVRHDLEEINMRRSLLGRSSMEKTGTRSATQVAQMDSISYKLSHVLETSTYETTNLVIGNTGNKIDSVLTVQHTGEPLNPYRRTADHRYK